MANRLKMRSVADALAKGQQKTFLNWCNSYLSQENMAIQDVTKDLRDGVILWKLAELVCKEQIPAKLNTAVSSKFEMIDNLNHVLKFLRAKKLKLENINADDIYCGHPKLILGLLWSMILKFEVANDVEPQNESPEGSTILDDVSVSRSSHYSDEVSTLTSGRSSVSMPSSPTGSVRGRKRGNTQPSKTAGQHLLKWVEGQIKGYKGVKVKNFTTSWTDGMTLLALIHSFRPDLVKFADRRKENALANLKLGLGIAEDCLGVPHLLDAEDVKDRPDPRSMMTFVALLKNYFGKYHHPGVGKTTDRKVGRTSVLKMKDAEPSADHLRDLYKASDTNIAMSPASMDPLKDYHRRLSRSRREAASDNMSLQLRESDEMSQLTTTTTQQAVSRSLSFAVEQQLPPALVLPTNKSGRPPDNPAGFALSPPPPGTRRGSAAAAAKTGQPQLSPVLEKRRPASSKDPVLSSVVLSSSPVRTDDRSAEKELPGLPKERAGFSKDLPVLPKEKEPSVLPKEIYNLSQELPVFPKEMSILSKKLPDLSKDPAKLPAELPAAPRQQLPGSFKDLRVSSQPKELPDLPDLAKEFGHGLFEVEPNQPPDFSKIPKVEPDFIGGGELSDVPLEEAELPVLFKKMLKKSSEQVPADLMFQNLDAAQTERIEQDGVSANSAENPNVSAGLPGDLLAKEEMPKKATSDLPTPILLTDYNKFPSEFFVFHQKMPGLSKKDRDDFASPVVLKQDTFLMAPPDDKVVAKKQSFRKVRSRQENAKNYAGMDVRKKSSVQVPFSPLDGDRATTPPLSSQAKALETVPEKSRRASNAKKSSNIHQQEQSNRDHLPPPLPRPRFPRHTKKRSITTTQLGHTGAITRSCSMQCIPPIPLDGQVEDEGQEEERVAGMEMQNSDNEHEEEASSIGLWIFLIIFLLMVYHFVATSGGRGGGRYNTGYAASGTGTGGRGGYDEERYYGGGGGGGGYPHTRIRGRGREYRW